MNIVRSFVNCVIFHELCDRMQFEVDCVKSHHHVISEGLIHALQGIELAWCKWAFRVGFETNAIASPSNNVQQVTTAFCLLWTSSHAFVAIDLIVKGKIVSHVGGIIINLLLFFFCYYSNTPVAATL